MPRRILALVTISLASSGCSGSAVRREVVEVSELPAQSPAPSTEAPVQETAPSSDEALTEPAIHPCLARATEHAATLARDPAGPSDLVLVERGATFSATLLPDLDGDGVCDLDLMPSGGPWNKVWPHLLYTSRDCAYAGDVVDADLVVITSQTDAHRDIEASSSVSCAGWDFVWNRYAWDGARYRLAETVACCFCEEETGGCGGRVNPPECGELRDRSVGSAVSASCPQFTGDESID